MRVETIGDATLYLGDCLEILPTLPKVDAVVTDPPYGIGMGRTVNHKNGKYGKQSGEPHLGLDWDSDTPSKETFNKLIEMSAVQIFWGGNYFELPVKRGWIVWDKLNDDFYSTSDGELAWTNIEQRLKFFRRSHGMDKGFMVKDGFGNVHPTQKPIPLMEFCVKQATEAQTILDPFMGSGTTGVACANLGRKFIGIEICEDYFNVACERIDAAYRQGKLFVDSDPRPEAALLPGM